MFYRRIDFDPDLEDGFGESVQYVGVYVLKWNGYYMGEPQVAFVQADDPTPDLLAERNALREALEKAITIIQAEYPGTGDMGRAYYILTQALAEGASGNAHRARLPGYDMGHEAGGAVRRNYG